MAYKYEDRIYANSVVHSITENVFIETGETKEIKEVYRKARAFDEIRIIEKTLDVTGYREDAESYMYDVESIIENYLEDE